MPDRPVFKRIADNLRAQIECGVYAKGSAIPSETSLMQTYGVARMTVRAALGVLKEEGVLRSEQGRGVFVQEVYGRPASAEEPERLVKTLIDLRHALDLTQSQVATIMGVKQPTVSGFENDGSDPRLSTLQRYAQAVGVVIVWEIRLSEQPTPNPYQFD